MRASIDPLLPGRAAQRIWAEGLRNPLDWAVRTSVGTFTTPDRSTWHSADGSWTAELRRSRNRRHVYLALFYELQYLGRYDDAGWRPITARSRIRHLRSQQLALRLVA